MAIIGSTPSLFVADIGRSADFYAEILRFNLAFAHGDPLFYGQVERDGFKLARRAVDDYILTAQKTRRREEELWALAFIVSGLKDLYQELVDAGAPMFQVLRTEPRGQQNFIVEDPDGNLLSFIEDPLVRDHSTAPLMIH